MLICTKTLPQYCAYLGFMQFFAECLQKIAGICIFVDGFLPLCYYANVGNKCLQKDLEASARWRPVPMRDVYQIIYY
jgi:hypothetical protein